MVGWQAPYPPHGVITKYVLKYRPHNMRYGIPALIVLPPTAHAYHLTALKPNSLYDVQVRINLVCHVLYV